MFVSDLNCIFHIYIIFYTIFSCPHFGTMRPQRFEKISCQVENWQLKRVRAGIAREKRNAIYFMHSMRFCTFSLFFWTVFWIGEKLNRESASHGIYLFHFYSFIIITTTMGSSTKWQWGRVGAEFFRKEFTLNYLIATYNKPQVRQLQI